MKRRTATNLVNYQERAEMFNVGDLASPYGTQNSVAGRVIAVFKGIGMVDLETSRGVKRYPVEELQKWDSSGNPVPPQSPSAKRVALYWADKDRKYRMCKEEMSVGTPNCPKCGVGHPLSKTTYKRREGKSEHLLGCKSCLFLIKDDDIIRPGGA